MTEPTLFSVNVYAEARKLTEDKKRKRNWENHFQRWSDERSKDGHDPYGCCGYGSICDYCYDNASGRPCVRALNRMLREKKIVLDYCDYDFEKIWWLNGLKEATE